MVVVCRLESRGPGGHLNSGCWTLDSIALEVGAVWKSRVSQ